MCDIRFKKGDYIQRIDGISIYCVTASEGKYVYAVRCSTHSITHSIKVFKKTEVRKLNQLSIILTEHMYRILEIYKTKDLPRTIRLPRIKKINSRIVIEKPELLTFRTREHRKLFYTFTYKLLVYSDPECYVKLIRCINKTCGQKGI